MKTHIRISQPSWYITCSYRNMRVLYSNHHAQLPINNNRYCLVEGHELQTLRIIQFQLIRSYLNISIYFSMISLLMMGGQIKDPAFTKRLVLVVDGDVKSLHAYFVIGKNVVSLALWTNMILPSPGLLTILKVSLNFEIIYSEQKKRR